MKARRKTKTKGKRVGPGRPTLLTPTLLKKIAALVRGGDTPEVAAGVHGIGRSTHYEWLNRDANYRTAIARARDVFESKARATIVAGDSKGWSFGPARAALEVLSRRVPSRWSQRIKHEVDESNRLMLDALNRVCADPEVYARVCAEGDLSAVLISVCTELARLDSEGDASEPGGQEGAGPTGPIH